LVQEGSVAKLADDLYCRGNTPSELLANFSRLLDSLDKSGLRLSSKKTVICPKSTTVLGWIWQQGTISASPHRISTLSQTSPPTTVKGMRSFIGAYKFLSRVLPNCASIIAPLDNAISGLASQDKVSWSDTLLDDFKSAQLHLNKHKSITLPRATDILWIVTDGSVKNTGIGSTLYLSRKGKLRLAGFFSSKLHKHHIKWLPCEVEALGIAASVKHFSPYIIQSKHQCRVLTDSKPCVQALEKLCRGEFSHSPRVATFLSVASRYHVSIQHLSGSVNVPSDFASRNAPECINPSCQVCSFINEMDRSTVRMLSAADIMAGSGPPPFSNRPAWISLQSECSDLRRTHAHLTQGTRPSKKLTNIREVKRYLNVASLSRDGLLVVKKNEPFSPCLELIIVPQQLLYGFLTAMHMKLNHPSAHQLKQVVDRKFFALNMNDAIKQITENCHICASLRSLPKLAMTQTSDDPPESIGSSFAADVMRQNRQMVFVLRETVTSYTITRLLDNETQESLRSALLCSCLELRSLDGPNAVVRVDPAPGFIALRNDRALASNGISLEFGRVKNPNKNPVAERAIQELELELLKASTGSKTITAMSLAIATARLNSRIRSRGLSAREMWLQRDQFNNDQIPISDMTLIKAQQESRESNHPYSEHAKSPTKPQPQHPCVQPGDLVYIITDKSKTHARERYLVSSVNDNWCFIKKFSGPRLRDTSYKVKVSECMLVPPTVQGLPRQQSTPLVDDTEGTTSTSFESDVVTAPVEFVALDHDQLPDVTQCPDKDTSVPPVLCVPDELTMPATDCVTTTDSSQYPQHDIESSIDNTQAHTRPARKRNPPPWLGDYVP